MVKGKTQSCAPSLQFKFRAFHHTKRNSVPINNHSSFSLPPAPQQPLVCFLSLWMCLLWTFHINGIIRCLFFGDWLLSLSFMFSRFTHIVASVRASPLFQADTIPLRKYTTICLSIHPSMTLGCFCLSAMNIYVLRPCFQF